MKINGFILLNGGNEYKISILSMIMHDACLLHDFNQSVDSYSLLTDQRGTANSASQKGKKLKDCHSHVDCCDGSARKKRVGAMTSGCEKKSLKPRTLRPFIL